MGEEKEALADSTIHIMEEEKQRARKAFEDLGKAYLERVQYAKTWQERFNQLTKEGQEMWKTQQIKDNKWKETAIALATQVQQLRQEIASVVAVKQKLLDEKE